MKECPKCHSKDIVLISYGYPTLEAVEDSKKRDVHFGDCVIDVFTQPDCHYNDCGHDWVKE